METKDEKLWKLAKKKASLKITGILYVLIVFVLWVFWLLGDTKYMWPKWPMLGLSIAYFFQYIAIYQLDYETLAEKEYKKLKGD
jgi:hypothetical protein